MMSWITCKRHPKCAMQGSSNTGVENHCIWLSRLVQCICVCVCVNISVPWIAKNNLTGHCGEKPRLRWTNNFSQWKHYHHHHGGRFMVAFHSDTSSTVDDNNDFMDGLSHIDESECVTMASASHSSESDSDTDSELHPSSLNDDLATWHKMTECFTITLALISVLKIWSFEKSHQASDICAKVTVKHNSKHSWMQFQLKIYTGVLFQFCHHLFCKTGWLWSDLGKCIKEKRLVRKKSGKERDDHSTIYSVWVIILYVLSMFFVFIIAAQNYYYFYIFTRNFYMQWYGKCCNM